MEYIGLYLTKIHYYDSMIIIEKRKKEKPYEEKTGMVSFPTTGKISRYQRIKHVIKIYLLLLINKVLRFFRLGGFIWK
jgi:non-canonical (house-cleaning) NTP pyrophosphatase